MKSWFRNIAVAALLAATPASAVTLDSIQIDDGSTLLTVDGEFVYEDDARELKAGGYRLVETGTDRHGRVLAQITLADGRDVSELLIAEGHAQPWPNSRNPWCG